MLLQMGQIWFYESDYVTLHPNMTKNRVKMTHKLLQY